MNNVSLAKVGANLSLDRQVTPPILALGWKDNKIEELYSLEIAGLRYQVSRFQLRCKSSFYFLRRRRKKKKRRSLSLFIWPSGLISPNAKLQFVRDVSSFF